MTKPKTQKFKVPSYFIKRRSSEWSILTFLDAEFARLGHQFRFEKATNSWISSLRNLSANGKGDQATTAQAKVREYHKSRPGGLSDKTHAANWRDMKKRKKSNPPPPPVCPTTPPTRPIQHFYGPINQVNGSIHDSTMTLSATGEIEENSADVSCMRGTGTIVDIDDSEKRLRNLCLSQQQLRSAMVDTLLLHYGQALEDCILEYAAGLEQLDPAHAFIIDDKMIETLITEDQKLVLGQVNSLPTLPDELEKIMKSYEGVKTIARCREVAGDSLDDDVLWIGRIFEHMVYLMVNGALIPDPGEGALDTLVNPVLWDHNFVNVPSLKLYRKEVTLVAMHYQPYNYLDYHPRFDGVVRTRVRTEGSYELGLFEVSGRFDGADAAKWDKDRTKLIAGCRAMLYQLKELVRNDTATMKKLRVVGVLQAGLHVQLFIMSFVNRNVLHLRTGNVWAIPSTFESFNLLSNVITIAWKAKKVITDTATAVENYLEGVEMRGEEAWNESPLTFCDCGGISNLFDVIIRGLFIGGVIISGLE